MDKDVRKVGGGKRVCSATEVHDRRLKDVNFFKTRGLNARAGIKGRIRMACSLSAVSSCNGLD